MTDDLTPYPMPSGYWRIPGVDGSFPNRAAVLEKAERMAEMAKWPNMDGVGKAYCRRIADTLRAAAPNIPA